MNCRICEHPTTQIFTTRIMNGKHEVRYFECPNCKFIQVEDPHWLEEAYASPMNLTDTGVMFRNLLSSKTTSAIIWALLDPTAKFLDYSGGFGVFTRLMRDIGFDYYWQDPYTTNLLARGFEWKPEYGKAELATLFEVFEHFVTPVSELEQILKVADNILFSTEIAPTPTRQPDEWWYYGLEHGQHTAFYREQTFRYLAQKFDLQFYTNGGTFHFFSKRKLVPRFITAAQYSSLRRQHGSIITKAYKTEALSLHARSVKGVAITAVKRLRYGKFYLLDTSRAHPELAGVLANGDFMQEYFQYLAANAPKLFDKFVTPNMTTRTSSDMELMKKYIH